MAEKKKPRIRDVVTPGQAGAGMIADVAKKLKKVTPKPPKKKTPTW